jgi:hypothetical protein
VLNGRLAYLSYNNADESETLTLLDTRDLENVEQIDSVPTNLLASGQAMVGILGARGSATNEAGDGGTLNLMLSACLRDACTLEIQPVFVGSSVTTGTSVVMGTYAGTPAFTNALEERRGFIAMHETGGAAVRLFEFDPFNPTSSAGAPISSTSQALGGLLLLECENAVALSVSTEHNLRGTSLQGSASAPFALMRAAQRLHFEAFSGKVVAPFNEDVAEPMPLGDADPPAAALQAFSVVGNGVSAPTISELPESDWLAPADLAPLTASVRTPITYSCD